MLFRSQHADFQELFLPVGQQPGRALHRGGQADGVERIVLLHEFKAGLQRYLTRYNAPVRSLDQVIAWNRDHADKELLPFGQDLMEAAAATPTHFTWNWTDGSAPTHTTDPGHPWPHHTLAHTYTTTGDYTVTMTTTWTGEYSLDNGTTYTPIDGTATTTSTAPRARLVWVDG